MHDGRSRSMWGHTSAVLALVANTSRDPRRKPEPFRPGDFDPHARKAAAARPTPKVSIKSLRGVLMGLKPGKG